VTTVERRPILGKRREFHAFKEREHIGKGMELQILGHPISGLLLLGHVYALSEARFGLSEAS